MEKNTCTTCRHFVLVESFEGEDEGYCEKSGTSRERLEIGRKILRANGYTAVMSNKGVHRKASYDEEIDFWPVSFDPSHIICTKMWEEKEQEAS